MDLVNQQNGFLTGFKSTVIHKRAQKWVAVSDTEWHPKEENIIISVSECAPYILISYSYYNLWVINTEFPLTSKHYCVKNTIWTLLVARLPSPGTAE